MMAQRKIKGVAKPKEMRRRCGEGEPKEMWWSIEGGANIQFLPKKCVQEAKNEEDGKHMIIKCDAQNTHTRILRNKSIIKNEGDIWPKEMWRSTEGVLKEMRRNTEGDGH
jgi:hypothetical protein